MQRHWQAQSRWRAPSQRQARGPGRERRRTRLSLSLQRPELVGLFILGTCVACHGAPASQFPTGAAALDRMRATLACSRGIQGEAELDYFGEEGRVSGSVLYYASLPDRLRFDVISPFGVTVSTLTSDGRDFALYDLSNKNFLYGPATSCNVARFTRVPVPPFALVQMLHGEAPLLVHQADQAEVDWDGGLFSGQYVVRIASKHGATEEIDLVPVPDDFDKPWQEQRVRVLNVRVEKQGVPLYAASMRGHHTVATQRPLKDPDGLSAPLLPTGPACSAEVPQSLRIEVPPSGQDVVFRNREQWHNPPLPPGVFAQPCPKGMSCRYSSCDDGS